MKLRDTLQTLVCTCNDFSPLSGQSQYLQSYLLAFVNAEINHVIALIELESLVLRISSNCKIFDVADIGSVPGYNK